MPGCARRPAPAGRLLHLTLRQGNRLTLRQPLQSGSHLLQNSAIDAATAERQGRNSAVKRPLAKGVLQLKYRLRQLLAIVTIRLVCLQQGRQLVAAQSGGQPRAPGQGSAAISGVARLAWANSDCS